MRLTLHASQLGDYGHSGGVSHHYLGVAQLGQSSPLGREMSQVQILPPRPTLGSSLNW